MNIYCKKQEYPHSDTLVLQHHTLQPSSMTNENAITNGGRSPKPHIVLVPVMAQGHMIPMVDMARLLADSGALVSFITTPVNADRIRSIIDRAQASALSVRFVELEFPAVEVGLPAGCENFDLIPSPDLFKPFVEALYIFDDRLRLHLEETRPAPDCVIFDSMHSRVAAVAQSLGIPHLIFYGPSCFYIHCAEILRKNTAFLDSITDGSERFAVPGLPHRIEIAKSQAVRWIDRPGWEEISQEYYAAEASALGVVINTYEELEPLYLEAYRKETGKKVWPVGPLSLYNKDVDSKAVRGKASSIDSELLLSWLDAKEADSVLLVSFGSISRNQFTQLIEIGRGLELAERVNFIWVVKETAEKGSEEERWMGEFEERTEGRGLVIRGWAPQSLILTHPALGGFMTHCGWNSTLEAVAAGVPMVTWPRFGDQFLNERLVVDVLGVGVAVGAKVPILLVDGMSSEAQVKGEEVREAVERLMEGGEDMRRRARELGDKAKKAMEKGGSSSEYLLSIIQFAIDHEVVP